jgi:hypothetical protein
MNETPDVAGTVRGYRSWRLMPGGVLHSTVRAADWTPGVNTATCTERPRVIEYDGNLRVRRVRLLTGVQPGHDQPVPVMSCTCGLYAVTNPDSDQVHRGVQGVVELWGGIVEHESNDVVRASKAQIVALCMSRWDYPARDIRAVKANYPDVQFFGSMEKMLAAFPPAAPRVPRKASRTPRRTFGRIVLFNAGVAVINVAMFARGLVSGHHDWFNLGFGVAALGVACVLRRKVNRG